MATIIDAVNTNLLRYINGINIQAAKIIIKQCPAAIFNNFAAMCMFAAATNRRAVEQELRGFITAGGQLETFINNHVTIEDPATRIRRLNITALVLIGFLFLASGFHASSAFRRDFAARYGNANIHAAGFNVNAASTTRATILTAFKNKFNAADFNAAVNKIDGILDAAHDNLVNNAALATALADATW